MQNRIYRPALSDSIDSEGNLGSLYHDTYLTYPIRNLPQVILRFIKRNGWRNSISQTPPTVFVGPLPEPFCFLTVQWSSVVPQRPDEVNAQQATAATYLYYSW
jgi:hypothetical protein